MVTPPSQKKKKQNKMPFLLVCRNVKIVKSSNSVMHFRMSKLHKPGVKQKIMTAKCNFSLNQRTIFTAFTNLGVHFLSFHASCSTYTILPILTYIIFYFPMSRLWKIGWSCVPFRPQETHHRIICTSSPVCIVTCFYYLEGNTNVL